MGVEDRLNEARPTSSGDICELCRVVCEWTASAVEGRDEVRI